MGSPHTPTAVAATATSETSATPTVECKLVGGGQVKPGVIQVAVNIFWLNAGEPLVFTGNHPVFHDRAQHIKAADVQPAFTLPSARVHVADHDATILVQRRHRGGGGAEEINVVHRNVK